MALNTVIEYYDYWPLTNEFFAISDKPVKQAQKTPTKSNTPDKNSRSNSKDSLAEDNISQSSLGGGIKGKLAALFNKEQTISETTIANKFKKEREREMEMLQNRFHYKVSPVFICLR